MLRSLPILATILSQVVLADAGGGGGGGGGKQDGWMDIDVPSNWQLECLGCDGTPPPPPLPTPEGNADVPVYTNIKYPFDPVSPPMAPKNNFVGTYALLFAPPPAWFQNGEEGTSLRGEVFLRFEAVRSAFHVWLNGHPTGFAQDSFTPKEFRIGRHLKPTGNVLFVRVYRWSVGSYLEDQDFCWDMSSIIRSVCMHLVAPVYLRDVTIRSDFTSSGSASFPIWASSKSGSHPQPNPL